MQNYIKIIKKQYDYLTFVMWMCQLITGVGLKIILSWHTGFSDTYEWLTKGVLLWKMFLDCINEFSISLQNMKPQATTSHGFY
jgi:hypothetical protein